ncbi:phage major capsid protein [Thioclava sp. BHET1]|nr:phage major capsid protein [Thioclava sp. BHET1]
MKNLDDLRRARKAAADKMQSCAANIATLEGAETADDAAIATAQTAFDAAKAEFDGLDQKVKRGEAVEAAQASAAQPADQTQQPGGAPVQTGQAALPKNPAHKAIEVGMLVHAIARTGGDRQAAANLLEKDGYGGVSAILNGTTGSTGGITIPEAQSSELIELLRPMVVVRASGARSVPMPAGELRHARMSGSASASYGAETSNIVESEPSFDNVDQKFKKLTSLVPVSNSLLRYSSIAMMQEVRNDVLKVMALREDLAFLRGDGTAGTPTGLRNWAPAANWLASIAKDAASVEAALRKVVSLVEDANVAMLRPGWIMRASTRNFLASLRNANGYFVFPGLSGANGSGYTLLGFPVRTTSQVPDNLGTNGDETEVTFADFSEVMIGDSMQISIDVSPDATFVDQSGNVVSAFQKDLTLVRAISEHDLAPEHDAAIAGLNGVGWSL